MALIHVPKPAKNAYNPNRPVSSLLKSQIDHLKEAENKLPLSYRSEIYIKAIKTEGEAARYIRDVTEAIHLAHEDAERARHAPRRKRVIEIAAAADEGAESRTRASKRRTTNSKTKSKKTRVSKQSKK
jgi:hypothetical protein